MIAFLPGQNWDLMIATENTSIRKSWDEGTHQDEVNVCIYQHQGNLGVLRNEQLIVIFVNLRQTSTNDQRIISTWSTSKGIFLENYVEFLKIC